MENWRAPRATGHSRGRPSLLPQGRPGCWTVAAGHQRNDVQEGARDAGERAQKDSDTRSR
eukprot:253368-Amphidinium_carterae.4